MRHAGAQGEGSDGPESRRALLQPPAIGGAFGGGVIGGVRLHPDLSVELTAATPSGKA